MRISRLRRIAVVLGSLLLIPVAVLASASEIVVDLSTGLPEPRNPTINLQTLDSVTVRIKGNVEAEALLAMPTFKLDAGRQPQSNEALDFIPGNGFVLNFRECREDTPAKFGPHDSNRTGLGCPFAHLEQSGPVWTVYTRPGALLLRVRARSEGQGTSTPAIPIVIQVESRPFVLDWSVGLAFFDQRDRQYQLVAIPGTELARFNRVSDGSLKYQFAAFAHYAWAKNPDYAVTAGFGVDVPVERLTTMVGLTRSFRTVPIANSAHLTVGISYTYRKELKPEFQELEGEIVPASLEADTLLEDKAVLGGFVAISFSFWGGEDKFKGVYPGSAN